MGSSELVESNDIDRLDIIFHSLDHLLNNISRDLRILNRGTNLNLEDSVSNGFLFPLGLPGKTIHIDSENLVSKSIKIGFLTPWLDFPNDERLGRGRSLLRLGCLGISFLFLHGLGGSGISLRIFCQRIELFLFCSWSGFGSLCLGLATLSLSTFSSDYSLLLASTKHFDLSSRANHQRQLAHLEEPSGCSGHSLAESTIEGKGEGEQKCIESSDISEGESIANKPFAIFKLGVEDLDSLLYGLDSIIVSFLVFLQSKDMKGSFLHVGYDSRASKADSLVNLCFFKGRVAEEALIV